MAADDNKTATAYGELVDFVVGSLLDDGTDYRVEAEESGAQLQIRIITPDEVRGRVIGRGGRIARAMRSMVAAADIAVDKKVSVDIVD
jgi:uncharacterized protein